jgi:hypothetical protein
VLQARLYPINETAQQVGLVVAQVSDHQGGRGTLWLAYKGQWMQGEATRDTSARRGLANAVGGGLSVQCSYTMAGTGQGTGECRFSDGAHYQLHFGR